MNIDKIAFYGPVMVSFRLFYSFFRHLGQASACSSTLLLQPLRQVSAPTSTISSTLASLIFVRVEILHEILLAFGSQTDRQFHPVVMKRNFWAPLARWKEMSYTKAVHLILIVRRKNSCKVRDNSTTSSGSRNNSWVWCCLILCGPTLEYQA